MTVTFCLTFRDQFRALRAAAWRTTIAKLAYAFFLGSPLITVLLVVATNPDPWSFLLQEWTGVAAGPAFIFLLIPLLQVWTVYIHRKHNASLQGQQTYEFSPAGVTMRGELYSTELRWEAFYRVVETRHDFLFYHSKAMANILPKRVFGTVNELQEFRDLLREHLAQRAYVHRQ